MLAGMGTSVPAVPAVRAAVRSAAIAMANPGIRRVETAWLLGFAAEAALMVTFTVALYDTAGATGVALLGAARMLPATFAGLFAAVPLARWRADRILIAMAVTRAAAGLVAVAMHVAGLPAPWLLLVAAGLGIAGATVRPVHNTALPTLARSPEELVAANVATSTAEAVGTFAGPAIAAALLAAGAPALIGLVAAGAMVVAVVALAGIRYESVDDARGPVRRTASAPPILAGLRSVARRPAVALTILGFGAQTITRGLMNTLIVVASVRLLGMGEPGVGVLGAALGVGGAFGLFAGLLVGRSSPRGFVIALACWGAPLVVIGLVPVPLAALAALAAVGLANALLDIVGFTIIQRGSANDERGPAFAIVEAVAGLGAIVGSLMAPALVAGLGPQNALVAAGLFLPVVAVVLAVLFRGTARADLVPAAAIARLKAVPAFAALPLTGLERLAYGARPAHFPAGATLMRKGDVGDTFVLLRSGTVRIDDDGQVLDTLGPGAGIGEIALLRDGIRTATATAVTDVEAEVFDAGTFRAAISGPAGSAAIECLVTDRLARSGSAG